MGSALRAILPALLGVLLLLPVTAVAGSVYRCVGSDGTTAYTSKRLPGARCKLVSRYRSATRKHAQAAPAAVTPPGEAAAADDKSADESKSPPVAARKSVAPPTRRSNAPRLVRGQVYSYVGKDGVRTYASARPHGIAASAIRTIKYSYIETCYACTARPGVDFRTVRLNMSAYAKEIRAAARDYGVDEALVRAIIHAESAFNPNAVSRAGAQGLMQLMPATARRFGVGDAFDAGQNIRGGVEYLAWLLKRFGGDVRLAAAGYNAGEGAVDKYDGVPPYQETQRYVVRVGQLVERYRSALSKRS